MLGRCRWLLVAALLAGTFALAPSTAFAGDGDTVDGRSSGSGRLAAGETLALDVTGRGGTGGRAAAVSLNLTVTDATASGYATVFPCGAERPQASTINFGPGATVANSVIATVGKGGEVCIYTYAAAHVVADVTGFFPAGGAYHPLTPARLLDTRPGQPTVDGRTAGAGIRGADSIVELDVAGRGGTAAGATAVSLNLTMTGPEAAGFATVFPCGTERPRASTVNVTPGVDVANAIIAKVGDGGKVCIYTSARSHVVVDATGYFTGSSEFQALTPARLLDTRSDSVTVDGRATGDGIRPAGSVLELDVTDRGGTDPLATAVSLNLTATQTQGVGFATVYPCGTARPEASTINFGPGATIANGLVATVGEGGKVCIYTHARTHLVVDVDGFFRRESGYRPLTPARLLDTRSAAAAARPGAAPSGDAAATSLALINDLRAAHGAGPLVIDPALDASAMAWSQEMSRTGFGHSTMGYAENIAWHSLAAMPPQTAAGTLHEMWVNSPAHFANMIDPRWTRVGIGLYVDGSGWYGTHLFAD